MPRLPELPGPPGRLLEEVRRLAVELPRTDEAGRHAGERESVLRLGDRRRDRGRDRPADVEGRGDHEAGGGRETADRLEDTARRRVAGIRGAEIAVVTRGGRRVGAAPGRRVADARLVAGVLGGADDRVRAHAETGRAGVGLRAAIAVAARCPVRLRRWLTLASRFVACPVVALVPEEGAIAGGAPAHACAAGVAHGAEEPIIAGHAIGFGRGGADAGDGVAAARDVALIGGGADDRVCPDAGAGLAGVGLGAGVAVRASAAVRLGRGGAAAARRVAVASDMALVEGGADDGV